jgi:hypothetical protein
MTGAATIVIKMYDLILGSDATPADQAGEFVVNRITTAGVGGTTLTETQLDPLTVATSAAICRGGTYTTDPVDTANTEMLMIGLNQRATFRWVAAPGGEIRSKAVANEGLFVRSVAHTATPNINVTVHWEE